MMFFVHLCLCLYDGPALLDFASGWAGPSIQTGHCILRMISCGTYDIKRRWCRQRQSEMFDAICVFIDWSIKNFLELSHKK